MSRRIFWAHGHLFALHIDGNLANFRFDSLVEQGVFIEARGDDREMVEREQQALELQLRDMRIEIPIQDWTPDALGARQRRGKGERKRNRHERWHGRPW